MTNASVLMRASNADYLDAELIARHLSAGDDPDYEVVQVDGNSIPFALDTGGMTFDDGGVSTSDEVQLAIRLHEALIPARSVEPQLLMDPGIWTWIATRPMREYVVARWCGGRDSDGQVKKSSGCSYFLTGNSLPSQTRCAPRRLWIASNASQLADGTYDHVGHLLKYTDLYTGIFERMLGLDAELAVEIASQMVPLTEDQRRKSIRLLGVILSTTALEFLNRAEKAQIVKESIESMGTNLIA